MITGCGESKMGVEVTLTDEECNRANNTIWSVADDTEFTGIRFNFYLHNLKSNLDSYGVAVNRHWSNPDSNSHKDEQGIYLIDDLVRLPGCLPRGGIRRKWDSRAIKDWYTWPALFYQTDPVVNHRTTSDSRDRCHQFGRFVLGVSPGCITLIADMIDEKAHVSEVQDVLSQYS
ncbi:MAG: hypothetical protein ABI354_01915 [Candidatus Saccharimonadales bacterium]